MKIVWDFFVVMIGLTTSQLRYILCSGTGYLRLELDPLLQWSDDVGILEPGHAEVPSLGGEKLAPSDASFELPS